MIWNRRRRAPVKYFVLLENGSPGAQPETERHQISQVNEKTNTSKENMSSKKDWRKLIKDSRLKLVGFLFLVESFNKRNDEKL